MLPAERDHVYSAADALAIDALFKRLAERGRRIRAQKKTTALAPAVKIAGYSDSTTKPAIVGENGRSS